MGLPSHTTVKCTEIPSVAWESTVFKLILNGWRWHADQFAMVAFLTIGW